MIRKLLPICIFTAFSGHAALAQVSTNINGATVTLSGNLAAQFINIKATGSSNVSIANPDKPARWRVDNVSSDFFVKSSYDLGSGLTALGQIGTGVQSDVNGNASQAQIWGSAKDTFVGLGIKDVGTVKIGFMTAAARWISGTADFSPAGAGEQDDQAAWHKTGGATKNGALWGDRFQNAIGFESATWSGFSFRAYYSADEGRSNDQITPITAAGATTNAVTAPNSAAASLNDPAYSLGFQYVNGPLEIRLSDENRKDKGTLNGTTTNNTKDNDKRIAVRYKFPTNTTLALGYGKMSFKDTTATGGTGVAFASGCPTATATATSCPNVAARKSLDKSGWVLGAKQTFGPHAVYGGYGKSANYKCENANGTVCDGTDTGMSQWVLAYNYQFNKYMVLEVFATQLKNEARAAYNYDSSAGPAPSTGATSTAYATGFRYSF
jgi:predicted porin